MATGYPTIWAATTNRVWHTGHIHDKKVDERPGCIVESHESPALRDAWHDGRGYRSLHSNCNIIYDQRGEHAHNIVWVNLEKAA